MASLSRPDPSEDQTLRNASPDWMTALLERPLGDTPELGPAPLSWLPGAGDDTGFVQGLSFDRSLPEVEAEPEKKPDAGSSLTEETTGAETGGALEDILRKALARNEADEGAGEAVDTPAEPEQQAEPKPDAIAEAFARGEAAGRQAGHQAGHQAGRQAALAEQEAFAAQKFELRQTFRTLDQAAMDALAGELGETVIALCAQTLADYIPDKTALEARCKAAALRLGQGISGAVLHLHPDDCALLDEANLTGWQIVGDPLAQRGSLRFETPDSSVSDSPSDWNRAISSAIRGESLG